MYIYYTDDYNPREVKKLKTGETGFSLSPHDKKKCIKNPKNQNYPNEPNNPNYK